MARRKRQPAGLRRYWAKHRRKASVNPHRRRTRRARRRTRRNPFTVPGVIVNRRRRISRRRAFTMKRRRSSYRRNPQLLGFAFPPVMDVLGVSTGFIIPPVVMRYLMPMLPADMQASKPVQYGVKIASVLLPAWAVKKFASPRIGNLMMLGGMVSIALDLIRETRILTSLGLSGTSSQPMLGFYPGLSRRGGLGKYPSLGNGQANVTSSRMLQSVPERLNPQSRF